MKKKWIKDLTDKEVVNVRSEEEDLKLRKRLSILGYRYKNRENYTTTSLYNKYKEKTAYAINLGTAGSIDSIVKNVGIYTLEDLWDFNDSVINDMDLPHTYTPQADYGEKPEQYASLKTDTFKRMAEDASNEERIGFVRGNIDKYNWRNKGTDKEDLKKIIAYAKWALNNIDYD